MIQIQFTHFPGYEPIDIRRGWRWLNGTPYRSMQDDDVFNLAYSHNDSVMELVDWALDNHPAVFDISDDDEYEAIGDLSIDLAQKIIHLAEDVIDNKQCVPCEGGIWSERYQDIFLTDDVVVRVSYFARKESQDV